MASMSYVDDDDELEDWPTSAPTTPSRRHSDWDEEDEDSDGFPAHDEPSQGFATHTSFDAYFQQASKPSRTSANVFSALVPPLPLEEYTSVLRTLQQDPRETTRVLWRDPRARRMCFRRWRAEMREGFNLMMYGCGSKREVLNAFARHLARGKEGGHVVVANGFQPRFAFKDLLSSIEMIPGVLDGTSSAPSQGPAQGQTQGGAAAAGSSAEAQTARIHAFFSAPAREEEGNAPHLYLIIHNIEGAGFRNPKARAALALLALAPRIHVVASVDHIAGAQRWSLSELFTRKPDPLDADGQHENATDAGAGAGERESAERSTRRGFAWLWHDLTTLAPYDFELAYADPTSLSGAAALRGARTPAASAAVVGAGGTGAGAGVGTLVTETAARHVLASVTQKAKKLFVLLGTQQLSVMDAPAPDGKDKDKEKDTELEERAYDYDRLFAAARDNFVATNDTALRALLGEFRDHGLVVTTSAQGAEAMWIPMRREALLKLVGELKAEGH